MLSLFTSVSPSELKKIKYEGAPHPPYIFNAVFIIFIPCLLNLTFLRFLDL